MHMVGVGDIVAVGHARDDAEALLQALGELVGRGFQRRAVEAEVDVGFCLPLGAGVVHVLHDLQRERLGGRVGVALAGHILAAFVQARVAQTDGGVAAVQQLVDRLAFLQAGQRAVLPQDGRGVGQGALETVVAAHERGMAQVEPLVKNLPEAVKIAAGGQRHIDQVDGDDALVEAAVVFRLAVIVFGVGDIVPAVAAAVRREEAAAAHAGVHVAVAFGLALGELILPHLLFADIVRHHALGGALGGQLGQVEIGHTFADVILLQHIDQLGERRGDPHAGFVLDALVALAQHLLDDDGKVGLEALVLARFAQVHEHRDERRLAVGGHEGDDLVLDGLHAALDLLAQAGFGDLGDLLLAGFDAELFHLGFDVAADLFAADVHKRREMGQADALAAVLVGRDLRNDLGGDVAGRGEGVGLFDQRAGDDGAVLQHVVQVDGGVLVGVLLLDLLVVAFDESQDAVVGRVVGALEALHIAVGDVLARDLERAHIHDRVFNQVLDLLHVHGMAAAFADALHFVRNVQDLLFLQALVDRDNVVGLCDRRNDLGNIENGLAAIPLDDLHVPFLRMLCCGAARPGRYKRAYLY